MNVMTPRKPTGGKPGKKPNRSGVALGCYVDTDIREAMDAYIANHNETSEHPASVRSTVEAALKAFLKGKGFYPLQKPSS
jgi:hypothetical protein